MESWNRLVLRSENFTSRTQTEHSKIHVPCRLPPKFTRGCLFNLLPRLPLMWAVYGRTGYLVCELVTIYVSRLSYYLNVNKLPFMWKDYLVSWSRISCDTRSTSLDESEKLSYTNLINTFTARTNKHCVDFILGPFDHFVPPPPKKRVSITEGFHLLHFPKNESLWTGIHNTHIYTYLCESGILISNFCNTQDSNDNELITYKVDWQCLETWTYLRLER